MSSGVIYPIVDLLVKSEWLSLLDQVLGVDGSPPEMTASYLVTDEQGFQSAKKYSGPVVGAFQMAPNLGYLKGPNNVLVGDDWASYTPEEKKSSSWLLPPTSTPPILGFPYFSVWSVPSGVSQSDVENYLKSPIDAYPQNGVTTSQYWFQYYASAPASVTPYVTISQNAEEVLFDTSAAVVQNHTQTGQGQTIENGEIQNTAINQVLISVKEDGAPLTDKLTFTANTTASTTSSTTLGVSNTISVSVGASLQTGIKDVASMGVNTQLQESTTVNTSTTEASTQSVSLSQSNSIEITCPPGHSYLAEQTYIQQTTSIPFDAPITLKGEILATMSGATNLSNLGKEGLNKGLGNAPVAVASAVNTASTTYGYFPASMIQGSDTDSSAKTATVFAKGVVTNVNVGEFLATDEAYTPPSGDAAAMSSVKVYATPSISVAPASALQRAKPVNAAPALSTALLSPEQVVAKKVSQGDLPTVVIDGVEKKVGLYYTPDDDWGDHLAGGDLADLIHIAREGQTVSTHGGHDRVYGTEGKDHVYLDSGLDQAHTFAGDDLIVARSGSHLIKSGAGNDRIELFLGRHDDDLGVHTIEAGDDSDSIHFHKEGRDFSRIVALVEDFSSQDNLTLHGFDEVTGQVMAGSLYLKENDRYFAKFQDFSGGVPIFGTREELIEHALLNAGRYGSDILSQDSLQDVMNEMVTHELLDSTGSGPKTEYSSVKDSISDAFVALDSIAREFDIDPEAFVYRGVLARGDFSNMRDLVDHLLGSDPGLSDEFSSSSNLMDWW